MESWRTENLITMICATTLILGLFAMSHSWHSLWSALILLNMNYPATNKKPASEVTPNFQGKQPGTTNLNRDENNG